MGRFARPRAPEETQPTIDVRVQVREEEYLLRFSSFNRVVCDPKETRLARHKHRGAGPSSKSSRTEQQEERRRGKKKKGTTRAVPEWSPTSVLNAPDEV